MCPTNGQMESECGLSYDILELEVGEGECMSEWLRMDVGRCFYSSDSDGKHDFQTETDLLSFHHAHEVTLLCGPWCLTPSLCLH